jgi:hypothetical protein
MDPIFDFILEGEPHEYDSHKPGQYSGSGHMEDDKEHSFPSSPTSQHDELCGPPSPSNVPSPPQQNEIEEINDEYLSAVANTGRPISAHVRDASIALIEEYLNDSIPLKAFLSKMRAHLCSESDRKDMFDWVIRSMISCGHSARMSSFLEENGIKKEEIESASVPPDEAALDEDGLGLGEKRKRRERKRVSISRGLRSPPNKWTKQESEKLIRLVFEFGDKSWKKIAEQLGGGKTGAQCAQHWKRVLSPEIRKGSWDDQEEELLFSLVQKHGQSWKNIAAEIKTRTDIQCRYQYQKACLSRGCDWLSQEDVLLRKKVALSYQEHRPIAWTEVSKFIARAKLTKIPRTALECKERWLLISNHPTLSSPQGIPANSDPSMQLSSYNFNNYTYHSHSAGNNSLSAPSNNSNNSNISNNMYYSGPPSNPPGPVVLVC